MNGMMKKIFDIFFSLGVLFLFSPLLLAVVIALLITQGRPIFFTQERLGKNCRVFKVFKFRTMVELYDDCGVLLPDSERTTRIGSFLRSSSIDEFPGFVNVLLGHMSVVGPRPLPVHYKERYSRRQMLRHSVLPGITGVAQINGRNSISWQEKFEHDIWYVNNCSLLLDLKIIMLTVCKVLSRSDITPPGKDKMEEFTGDDTLK